MIADLAATFSERLPVRRVLSAAAVIALLLCPATARAQPLMFTTTDLGDLGGNYGTNPFPLTFALDATPNGEFIVGESSFPIIPNVFGETRAFLWSAEGGIQLLSPLFGSTLDLEWSTATFISDGADVVIGRYSVRNQSQTRDHVFRFSRVTAETQALGKPTVPGQLSTDGYALTAMSSDTSVLFGYSVVEEQLGVQLVPWYWIPDSNTLVPLTLPASPTLWQVTVTAVSDGSLNTLVAVGTCQIALDEGGSVPAGFRWTLANGLELLPVPLAVATDISADGSTICGYRLDEGTNRVNTFVWTQAEGVQDIEVGTDANQRVKISPDGQTVAYWSRATGVTTLKRWSPATGSSALWTQPTSTDGTTLRIVGVSNFGTKIIVPVAPNRCHILDFLADADGDGLANDWEVHGIPYVDSSGIAQRYLLDFDGDGSSDADPQHKDMFVEVDAMQGQGLSSFAISVVTNAFADAPLNNPDGTTGVRLHTHVNETDLPVIAQWQPASAGDCWPALPVSFEAYRDAFFATPADRLSPARVQARAKAVRYTIIAAGASGNTGGCGEQPGDNCVVFGAAYDNDFDVATAWMHELGHNLNLGHGGHDNINGKPNYPSIMNYAYGYQSPWNEEFWVLDFSRANSSPTTMLREIHESCTQEDQPIGPAAGRYASTFMAYSTEVIVNGAPTRTVGYISLGGGIADFNSNGALDPCTAADLNFLNVPSGISLPSTPSPGQTLQSNDDWAIVAQNLAPQAARGAAAAASSYPADEPTSESIAWIRANFPLPPGSGPTCDAIDFNNDTGFFDPQDIEAFLSVYAEGPCIPETATCNDIDFNNDGSLFDPCDIDSFLLVFSEGPCTLCGQ
jgi:hypothetical protein